MPETQKNDNSTDVLKTKESIDDADYLSFPFLSDIRNFVREELDNRTSGVRRIEGITPFIKMIPGFKFESLKQKRVLKSIDTEAGKSHGGDDFENLYLSDNEYRPRAGILDANIEYKDVTGATRKAVVNWVCHSLKDLTELSPYFLNPGYTCLLEWGWSPYGDSGTDVSDVYDGYTMSTYYKMTQDKIKTSNGNYDALLGYITNYEYKFNPNGSFSCSTTIVGIGDFINGISLVNQYTKTDDKESVNKFEELKTMVKNGLFENIIKKKIKEEESSKSKDILTYKTKYADTSLGEGHAVDYKFVKLKVIEEILDKCVSIQIKSNSPTETIKVPMASPTQLVMKLFEFNSEKSKFHLNKYLRTNSLESCIFPLSQLKTKVVDEASTITFSYDNIDEDNKTEEKLIGITNNIYVNVDMVKVAIDTAKTVLDAMTNILTEINNASSNFLNLKLQTYEAGSNTACVRYSIVDIANVPQNIKTKNRKETLYKFNAISKKYEDNTISNSVIKTFSFNNKMSNEAAMNVMYSAHSNTNVHLGNNSLYNSEKMYSLYKPTDLSTTVIDTFSNSYAVNNDALTNYTKDATSSNTEEVKISKEKVFEKYKDYYTFLPFASFYDSSIPNEQKYTQFDLNLGIDRLKSKLLIKDKIDNNSVVPAQEPILPLEVSMELVGISGIRTGDCFTIDYIPEIYTKLGMFQIKKISQEISRTGWSTKFSASYRIQIDMEGTGTEIKFLNDNVIRNNPLARTLDDVAGNSLYYSDIYTKSLIVLHHTAGSTGQSSVEWWKSQVSKNLKVSTSVIIERDGKLLNVYDPKYWSDHAGTALPRVQVNPRSIGIELANYGGLRSGEELNKIYANRKYDVNTLYFFNENNKTAKKMCLLSEKDKYYTTQSPWRNYKYFEPYTSAQMNSCFKLIVDLCNQFGIPKKLLSGDRNGFVISSVADFKGIISHANIREDKFDVHPGFDWNGLEKYLI